MVDWLLWAFSLDGQDSGFTWAGTFALWQMYGRDWIEWCWHGWQGSAENRPERPGTADH